MIIHFSIFLVILIVSLLSERYIFEKKIYDLAGGRGFGNKSLFLPWAIIFGYIAFIAAMRTDLNDTYTYVNNFNGLEASWEAIQERISVAEETKDWAFDVISILFKMFISDNYHIWFGFFAIIESFFLVEVFRKYAVSLFDTCFYFFCSALYMNYFTMMRQWFAVVILFATIRLVNDKKIIPYVIICLLCAQIHSSAYFMIPIYFIVRGKAWTNKQMTVIVLFAVSMFFLNPILSSLENVFSDTTYDYVIETMAGNTGSSPVRIVISAVPVILSYLCRGRMDNDTINLCVNMSLLNLLFTILATFTSGLFVIRFTVYLNMYNAILYPYLLNVAISEKNRLSIKTGFYLFFFMFYIYQMQRVGMAGWYYGSDILGKFY